MSEQEIIDEITKNFKVDISIHREKRLWIKTKSDNLIDLCRFIKDKMGFEHLSSLSITDWLKDGEYEITYHIWSYNDKTIITIKTRINRDNPEVESVYPIWGENAQIHEREMHEMFGVEFKGNPDLTPLFLEDWHGPPPFKKDFDWREYVRKEYYNNENERELGYFEE